MALIPNDPRQRNVALVAVLAVALAFVFWTYWYSPKSLEVAELTSQLDRLEQSNRIAQITVARGGTELAERLARYEQHVDRLEALIPQSEEVAALLNQISASARMTGVTDPEMRPEPDEVGDFYTKESYEIAVVGEYHDIGRFLTQIASLPRIITPMDLQLTHFQGDRELLDPDMETPLAARLRIQTYILPSQGDPQPAEGGAQSAGLGVGEGGEA
jgi:type IV pilus assembly protein PilO